jgi:hypothetical protein
MTVYEQVVESFVPSSTGKYRVSMKTLSVLLGRS